MVPVVHTHRCVRARGGGRACGATPGRPPIPPLPVRQSEGQSPQEFQFGAEIAFLFREKKHMEVIPPEMRGKVRRCARARVSAAPGGPPASVRHEGPEYQPPGGGGWGWGGGTAGYRGVAHLCPDRQAPLGLQRPLEHQRHLALRQHLLLHWKRTHGDRTGCPRPTASGHTVWPSVGLGCRNGVLSVLVPVMRIVCCWACALARHCAQPTRLRTGGHRAMPCALSLQCAARREESAAAGRHQQVPTPRPANAGPPHKYRGGGGD